MLSYQYLRLFLICESLKRYFAQISIFFADHIYLRIHIMYIQISLSSRTVFYHKNVQILSMFFLNHSHMGEGSKYGYLAMPYKKIKKSLSSDLEN